MVRTVETKVFTYDELQPKAQERARDWFRQSAGAWGWQSDWWKSAQAFAGIAPIAIYSADYDRALVETRWTGDDAVADLSGVRAWKWLNNNGWFDWARKEAPGACSLTGYCGDAAFADPLVQYEKTPASVPALRQVFYEMAQAWVREAQDDMEGSNTDEAVADTIEANEYEFTETGERFTG